MSCSLARSLLVECNNWCPYEIREEMEIQTIRCTAYHNYLVIKYSKPKWLVMDRIYSWDLGQCQGLSELGCFQHFECTGPFFYDLQMMGQVLIEVIIVIERHSPLALCLGQCFVHWKYFLLLSPQHWLVLTLQQVFWYSIRQNNSSLYSCQWGLQCWPLWFHWFSWQGVISESHGEHLLGTDMGGVGFLVLGHLHYLKSLSSLPEPVQCIQSLPLHQIGEHIKC